MGTEHHLTEFAKRALSRQYDEHFTVTEEYKNSLPDMQNADSSLIEGAHVPIIQVGIHNFRLPLQFDTPNATPVSLETSVTGTVSLQADHKGINMSRIMRTFYQFKQRSFSLELLEEILQKYKQDLSSHSATLRLAFSYPMLKPSLRSGLSGYQYYEVVLEGSLNEQNHFRKNIHFDFVYSSACPCSADLAEHARGQRDLYTIPHSQRSKARVSVTIDNEKQLSLETLHALCLKAIQTETQVMVKREDEQAFAELNGAYVKFVEDAARLLCEQLSTEPSITDYQIACSHLESLHSHDAVAVLHKGVPGGFNGQFHHFADLVC